MRKSIAIILFYIFLIGNLLPVQMQGDLARLPQMFQHFAKHRVQFPDCTFMSCLSLHYGSEFEAHRSAHDHSQLPLKSNDQHLVVPTPLDLPQPAIIVLSQPENSKEVPGFIDQSHIFLLPFDVWRPPRAC